MSSRLLTVLLSGTALLASVLPASAIEAEAAADALATALTSNTHNEATYDEATQSGANIVVKGLKISHAPRKAASTDQKAGATDGSDANADAGADQANADSATADDHEITFAQTVIESPTEGGQGVFQSPQITFSDGKVGGKSTGSIASATLSDVTVLDPSKVKGSDPAKGLLFHTAEAKDLRFSKDESTPPVTVRRIFMETGNVVDNVPQDNKGSVEDVSIPPEVFAESGFSPKTIGYDAFTMGVTWDGSRDPAAKTLTVRDFTLSLKQGGDLSITGVVGNLPAPTSMNDSDAAAKAAKMEVHSIKIRYSDQSLAGRILDMLAKQQGISRADYAKQIAGALPFLLAALNNPGFQNQVAGAVGTFLQDPKALTVTIAPKTPITGSEIMSIAGSAPQTLPDRLGASVTANTAD